MDTSKLYKGGTLWVGRGFREIRLLATYVVGSKDTCIICLTDRTLPVTYRPLTDRNSCPGGTRNNKLNLIGRDEQQVQIGLKLTKELVKTI